ncbi:MAG: aminotransferase class IV [Actinomycetota bacterium]|nr:aminotransferase class IV [Actinomycetota bacterium]
MTPYRGTLDGVLMDLAEMRIPVTDDGLLRGDGAFEILRLYGGRPFALQEHLDRLASSAAGLRLPVDLEAMRADVGALLEAVGAVDAMLRLVVTRGGRRITMIEDQPELPATIALATVTYSPTRILDGVKSLSYAANMLAGRLAREAGADEALLLTPHGRVLEAPTSAFFYVLAGDLCTPPLDDHILDSITRRRVIEVVGARERATTRDDLLALDEAFLASTAREVHPVHAIDAVALAAVPGPATQDAAKRVRERIAAELGGLPAG